MLRILFFVVSLLALLPLLAVLPACAGRPETHATGLLDVLRKHHDSIRWENYGRAGTQVDPAFRPGWSQITAELGRVSEYEIGSIDLKDPPGDDAAVMVRFSSFRVPDMTVRSQVMRERWRREGDHWKLVEMAPWAPDPMGM